MPISEVVQLFISKKMVEEHCSVHCIKICKGSSCTSGDPKIIGIIFFKWFIMFYTITTLVSFKVPSL